MKFVSWPKAIDFKRIFTRAKRININWKAVQFSKPKSSCFMPETDFIFCAFFNVVYCGGNRGFKSIVSNSDQNMALGLPCSTLARTIISRPFFTASAVCCITLVWITKKTLVPSNFHRLLKLIFHSSWMFVCNET